MQAIPMALMAAGSVVKGVASQQSGAYNQKVANMNADETLMEGNAQANKIRDAARMSLGRQIGAQAESGFMVNQGSALDNLVTSATNGEMQAMDAMRTAQSRANAYEVQGQQAYSEGENGAIGSVLGGAAQAVGAYNDYAYAGSRYSPYGYGGY